MSETKQDTKKPEAEMPKCGLIMPISAIGACTEQHWSDVKTILVEALKDIDFKAELVSEADDVGIIQKRIIQNVYQNPIVVCDVSGKNPNVMFELGMRLAFDKPTVIVKDDMTDYSFDTSPIEHIEYPRDLRFPKVVEFKKKIKEKVRATHDAAQKANHSTFLKHFGKFKVAKLETEEVDKEDYLLSEMSELKHLVMRFMRSPSRDRMIDTREKRHLVDSMTCKTLIRESIDYAISRIERHGKKVSLPEMEEDIMMLASNRGTLPECFDQRDEACSLRFQKGLRRREN